MTQEKDSTAFWKQVGTAGISFIIMMIGWWLAQGRNVAMRDDVSDMIQRESPYVLDKQIIFERLHNLENQNQAYMKAWDKNIEAINELKIELARLSFILDNMQQNNGKKVNMGQTSSVKENTASLQ